VAIKSPDLNPVALARNIQGIVQQQVCQSRVHSIDKLKKCLLHVWHGIDQTVIDNATDEWRGRLRTCVRAKSEQFEQLM